MKSKTQEKKVEKKLLKEELDVIVGLQRNINQIVSNIGALEVQKAHLLQQVNIANQKVENYKSVLQNKYGDINIDISTGVYTNVEDNSKAKMELAK
jgi:small-conductance mechanosensitive channel